MAHIAKKNTACAFGGREDQEETCVPDALWF